MIKAEYNDREHVVLLFAQAFQDNRSVNYIIQQDKHKTKRIYALMEYSFDKCFYFGEVWLTDDKAACALLLSPSTKRTSWRSIWLDIKLILKAIGIGRLGLALKREAAIKQGQWKADMLYLWFIGVDPALQHNGLGSCLLKEILSMADLDCVPVCLETSTLKNLPWYEHYGFEIYNELDLGYPLYFLKRNPR